MDDALPDRDYTRRRGELSAFGRAINSKNLVRWLLCALVASILLVAVTAWLLPAVLSVGIALMLIAAIAIGGALYLWLVVNRQLVEPELATRKWIQQICDGELRATIDLPDSHPHYKELDFHTRNVGTSLRRLSDEMETLVDSQTHRLESQNRALELLFRLTSDVAHEIDQQSVFNTVCRSISDWLETADVGAYMQGDDALELQAESASAAFADHVDSTLLVNEVTIEKDRVRVPVFRGKEVVGVLLVLCDDSELLNRRESQQVFKTLSEQLSVFVARQYVLESVQHARVVKERAQLGAEIHDSLAQTLLACRYQIRMLRESLERDPAARVMKDIIRVEGTIDEANVEVRELIGQTRQGADDQHYTEALQRIIDEHNSTGGIPVFFQNDNPHIEITPRESTVVQRVVREALVNANKYSNATTIRVYLRLDNTGVRSLLIEDDGDGFDLDAIGEDTDASSEGVSSLGDHIGLSIMRDRALSIGAILDIDSEPGEGTRISLKLSPMAVLNTSKGT